ncbi:MAG: L,D-transpeptidase family protein [Candidatus Moraniibacteriota bacterium]
MKSFRVLKIVSILCSVAIGLFAAFWSMNGVETLFPSVSAASASDTVRTPTDPVLIRFSEPLSDRGSIGAVSVVPSRPFQTEWRDGGKTLAVLPLDRWDPGSRYSINLAGGKDGYLKTVPSASFPFSVPDYPNLLSFQPANGATDVLLDIEDPITVSLDRSASDFYLDFRLSPTFQVAYENDPDKTTFRILPKEPLRSDTEYVLSVYAKWRSESDGTYRLLGETRFRTVAEQPAEWAKDINERAIQAKRYAHPLRTVGKYIDINLENQIMMIFQDGVVQDAYPISSGKRGMETPKGEYAIRNKADRAWSKAYGLFMPNWMALVPDGKFGIHELPEWPGGYKEGANHLGIPVSHGCVRLGVGPAKRVFDWTEIGTVAIVH